MPKKKIEKELDMFPPYITVELSERKHVIAHKVIGSKNRFVVTCELKNRNAAERLADKLNDLEDR